MPPLNPFAARSPLPARSSLALDLDLLAHLHLPSSRPSADPEGGRCTCGTRPLAVRLRMRSGQRPQFEGAWRCGRQCLVEAVKAVVRREFRSGHTTESRVRHRIPLGLILQTRGIITAEQLRHALHQQEQTGGRLGDILLRSSAVDERQIAAALAAQWNAPLWNVPPVPSQELLRLAPLTLFRLSGALPVRLIGTRLSIASADGVDAPIALALERMHGVTVESGISVSSSLDTVWSTVSTAKERTAEEVHCEDADEISRRLTKTIEAAQPVESRAVRVGRRMWLRLWLEPAAVIGGPCHANDILDYLFTCPLDSCPAHGSRLTALRRPRIPRPSSGYAATAHARFLDSAGTPLSPLLTTLLPCGL